MGVGLTHSRLSNLVTMVIFDGKVGCLLSRAFDVTTLLKLLEIIRTVTRRQNLTMLSKEDFLHSIIFLAK